MVRDHPSSINKRMYSILMCVEGKETRLVMQQVADDMDQVKSLSFFSALTFVCKLNHPYRESITTGPSKMALSSGSLY